MIGISLEGGGAKGSYQVGACLALKKHKIKPDMIAGTSIGAINASLLVTNSYYKLIKIWLKADSSLVGIPKDLDISLNKKTVAFIKQTIKNKGLDVSKLENLIKKEVNEKKVRKAKIKYGLVTVNLSKLKEEELLIDDIKEGKLHKYILASSYLPFFTLRKLIDDNYYIDGGFRNNNPISLLYNNGCREIYSVEISNISITKKIRDKNLKIISIKPSKDLGSFLNITKEQSRRNMRLGYLDALKVLHKLDGNNYYFKKKNDNYYLNLYKKYYNDNDNNYKEIIIKNIEKYLKENNYNELEIYNISKILRRKHGKSIFS